MVSGATTILFGLSLFQVYMMSACSDIAWYADTDHYWSMNTLYYRRVHERYRQDKELWTGYVEGKGQVTYTPVNVGLSMYSSDAWLDLQSHNNSCYIDPFYCHTGFTVAFWVNIRDTNTPQTLLNFGGCERGLTVVQTGDWNLGVNITSAKLGESWGLRSVDGALMSHRWNHIVLTWNYTDGIHVYINGSRLRDLNTTYLTNQTRWNSSEWSMTLGRDPCGGQTTRLDLDEMALWSHPVSNETVTKIYQWKTGVYLSNSGCGLGWKANQHFCYYKVTTTAAPWNSAVSSCKLLHSNLVSIGSKEENDFLESTLTGLTQCIHIGLTAGNTGMAYQWTDRTMWSFNKLANTSQVVNASGEVCVHRAPDGTWRAGNCSQQCGYICKKYRGGIFKRGTFSCRAKLFDQSLMHRRISITVVKNEMDCALECLIRGQGCRSYNYQLYTGYPQSHERHTCELNQSSDHNLLQPRDGYQYCERV